MKVVRRTHSELTLHESPMVVWLILGVFGVGGAFVLLHEGEPLFAALFAVVVGLLAAVFGVASTCRFDRASGELSCTSRSLVRTTHRHLPLKGIVGARIQYSMAHRSRATRVVVVTSSGEIVPLTSQFSSVAAEHERVAQAIREFLRLPEPDDASVPGFGDLLRTALGRDAR